MDAQERRRAEVDRIRGAAVDLLHTEVCKVLPTRNDLLDTLPKNGIAVEVGVASGDFTKEILDRLRPRKLHLIDAWEGARFANGLRVVRERFAAHLEKGDLQLHLGLSTEILPAFPDAYFDFVYIDTTHAYDLTVQELDASMNKVGPGGVIAGHDFCAGNVIVPHVYGVIQATALFCRKKGWRYKYITIDPDTYFSFCLERIPPEAASSQPSVG